VEYIQRIARASAIYCCTTECPEEIIVSASSRNQNLSVPARIQTHLAAANPATLLAFSSGKQLTPGLYVANNPCYLIVSHLTNFRAAILPSIEERFSLALHNTARAWRHALDRRLKDLGVGQAGWMTIAMIAKAEQALSQTQLADRLGIENPTMVAMVDRLVKAGLVTRAPSTTDRRVKQVLLTDDGKKLYGRIRTEADAFRTELLKDIDPAALAAMTRLLETLQGAADAAS